MTLSKLLTALGTSPAARYSLEDVAQVLGLTPRQVRSQIQKGRLVAIKTSARHWAWVLHQDLEAYLAAINPSGGE